MAGLMLEDFRWCEEALPEPRVNQMLTRTVYLSLDPYQWGRRRSGVEAPGDICHGRTVSQVVASRLPGYSEGDLCVQHQWLAAIRFVR